MWWRRQHQAQRIERNHVLPLPGDCDGNPGYTDGWFEVWNGGTSPITGGGDWTNLMDEWQYLTLDSTTDATDIGVAIRVEGGWTGTVYIDSVTVN